MKSESFLAEGRKSEYFRTTKRSIRNEAKMEILRETVPRNLSIIFTEDKSNASLFLERDFLRGRWREDFVAGNHRAITARGWRKKKVEEAFGADKGGSLEKRQWFLLEARSGSFGQRKPNKREENLIRIRGWPREASSLSANRYRSNKADWFAPDNRCRTESSCVLLFSAHLPRYTLYCGFCPTRQKIKVTIRCLFSRYYWNCNYRRNELTIKFQAN